MTITVRAHHNPMQQMIEVAVLDTTPDGMGWVLTAGRGWRPVQEGEVITPTFSKDGHDFLQAALNAAWEAGLRPAGFHDTTEAMKATQRHLEDMRRIAFDQSEFVKQLVSAPVGPPLILPHMEPKIIR